MLPPKLSDLENEKTVRQNKTILLLIGAGFLIFIALIAAAFYFHIFNLANVVSGNG
jgi:hypothetical protein